jgi:hypothetical protein
MERDYCWEGRRKVLRESHTRKKERQDKEERGTSSGFEKRIVRRVRKEVME